MNSICQWLPFLLADPKAFFPEPLLGPDNLFEPPAWFLKAIRGICVAKTLTPSKPPFRFEDGKEAAKHNTKLLQGFGYNLGSLIQAHGATTLGFRSEFRTVALLHFKKLSELLTNGMENVFTRELSETEAKDKVKAMLQGGRDTHREKG
jgi:hypothetical protein